MKAESIIATLSFITMSRKGLTRLCEPKGTGWVAMPLFVNEDGGRAPVLSISLFQVTRDEQILLGWRGLDTALPQNPEVELALLSQSFADIAARDDMQAFVVWKGELPVLQIDVVDANSVLAEISQAPPGSYLLYLKAPFEAGPDQLTEPLRHAMTFFFEFEEVQHLYTIAGPDDYEWKKTLENVGFTICLRPPFNERTIYTVQNALFHNT